ncbi:MAG: rhomboid family intramembrane serine protease [Candidatus Hydrogenedentes bacterium]|nr:rhomboid family intramembrane serine protease [Candidatus Hydrogenedentota bacterium]
MQLSPGQRKFLDAIGINSTRVQWKLYQWEKRVQTGPRLPAALKWLTYPHKACPKCRTLVHRDASVCPACNSPVYSVWAYRLFRFLGLMVPEGATPTVTIFLLGMIGLFGVSLMLDGPGGLMMPSGRTLMTLGAWSPVTITANGDYWRELAFGLIHIGAIHILFNFTALIQLGPVIEHFIGARRMLVVITGTQLAAAAASHAWYTGVWGNTFAISAGASGWLFGLIGFGIAYFNTQGGAGKMYTRFLVQWAGYGILFGLFMGANNAAHVGGMLGGLILGVVPEPNLVRKNHWEFVWTLAYWVSLAAWLITLGFMAHSIFTHAGLPVTPE